MQEAKAPGALSKEDSDTILRQVEYLTDAAIARDPATRLAFFIAMRALWFGSKANNSEKVVAFMDEAARQIDAILSKAGEDTVQ